MAKSTIRTKIGMGEEYNPWITLKKFLLTWGTGLIGMILTYSISIMQNYEWPPEMVAWVPVVIGLLVALENAYKHWNDGEQ